jgi:phosphoenolpyruvate synthase/pyruvate phosphate dikinase
MRLPGFRTKRPCPCPLNAGSPRPSYAGQYETVLGVEGLEAVAAAVRRCWASASAARVAAYERGRSAGAPRMAVLIQRLVPADASGVAFSANPVTGARDETLVSAVRGPAAVTGQADQPRSASSTLEPTLVTARKWSS